MPKIDEFAISNFLSRVNTFADESMDQQKDDVRGAGKDLKEKIQQAMDSGGPTGISWPEISEVTKKVRKAKGIEGTAPLLETRNMRDSIEYHEHIGISGVEASMFVGWRRDSELLIKAATSIFGTEGSGEGAPNISIPVTNAMETMMMLEYGVYLGHKNRIHIPARPLLRPCALRVWEENNRIFDVVLIVTTERLGIRLEVPEIDVDYQPY